MWAGWIVLVSCLWWDLFWYTHGGGRAIIYPVVVISDIACRLDHSLVCTYIMPHFLVFSAHMSFEGFSGTCCETTETLGCIPVNVGLEKTPLSQSSPRSIGICAMRAQGALVAALSTRESHIYLCTAASVLPYERTTGAHLGAGKDRSCGRCSSVAIVPAEADRCCYKCCV